MNPATGRPPAGTGSRTKTTPSRRKAGQVHLRKQRRRALKDGGQILCLRRRNETATDAGIPGWGDYPFSLGAHSSLRLDEMGLAQVLEIIDKPKDCKGFTVLYRCWVVERTFAWMGCRGRLAKDYERTVESSVAWAQLAAST